MFLRKELITKLKTLGNALRGNKYKDMYVRREIQTHEIVFGGYGNFKRKLFLKIFVCVSHRIYTNMQQFSIVNSIRIIFLENIHYV